MRTCFSILFLFISCLMAFGQTDKKLPIGLVDEYRSALGSNQDQNVLLLADSILSYSEISDSLRLEVLEVTYKMYGRKGDMKSLLSKAKELRSLNVKLNLLEDIERIKLARNSAKAADDLQKDTESLQFFDEADSLIKVSTIDSQTRLIQELSFLIDKGQFYSRRGQFEVAENLYSLGEELSTKLNIKENLREILRLKSSRGSNFGRARKSKESNEVLKDILKILEAENKTDDVLYMNNLFNVGTNYKRLGKYSDAVIYFEKGLGVMKKLFGSDTPKKIGILNNLGNLYCVMGEKEKGFAYYKETAEVLKKFPNDMAEIRLLTAMAQETDDLDECIKFMNQAKALNQRDETYDFDQLVYAPAGLNIYGVLAQAHWKKWKEDGLDSSLIKAREASELSQQFKRDWINAIKDDRDRQYIVNEADFYNEVELNVWYAHWKKERTEEALSKALQCAEGRKVFSLRNHLWKNKTFGQNTMLQDLIARENELKDELTGLFSDLHDMSEEDSLYVITKASIAELKQNLYKIEEEYKSREGQNYALLRANDFSDFQTIKKSLDDGELFVEYTICDTSMFVIAISQKEELFLKLPKNDSLHQLILQQDYLAAELELSPVRNKQLLEYLIPLELQPMVDKAQRLTIVPEAELSSFPFEILKLDNELLLEKQIRYVYSHTLFEILDTNESKSSHLFCGFASSYEDQLDNENPLIADLVRDGNYSLPGALQEVESIHKIVNGKIYTNNDCTKENFLSEVKNAKILHLSMHSLVDHKNPLNSQLLFTDTKDSLGYQLTASELYQTEISADLVVLSACNTGAGRMESSEGVMSMSRAFTYSGVGSVLHSLWKVPDASTSYIMIDFYKQLKLGKSKSHALALAKQNYLNDETIPQSQKTPYYWAGFVMTGNVDPIKMKSSKGLYISVLVGTILVLLTTRLRKKSAA